MAKFSLDALVNLATASGLAVHIQVAEAARRPNPKHGRYGCDRRERRTAHE